MLTACAIDDRDVKPTSSSSGTLTGGAVTVTTTSNNTSSSSSSSSSSSTGGSVSSTSETSSSGGGTGGATMTSTETSTTGAQRCELTAAASEPVVLAPQNGWVACDSNTLGVQGPFYTFNDPSGSTIQPMDFTASGSMICVTGEVAQVQDNDFESYWGSGVGFNLNQAPTGEPMPWDASSAGVKGFAFEISDMPNGTLVHFQVKTTTTQYCVDVLDPGEHSFTIAETLSECWDMTGTSPDPAKVVAIEWVVATTADSSHPFEFCISNVRALP